VALLGGLGAPLAWLLRLCAGLTLAGAAAAPALVPIVVGAPVGKDALVFGSLVGVRTPLVSGGPAFVYPTRFGDRKTAKCTKFPSARQLVRDKGKDGQDRVGIFWRDSAPG
jgi:hypothetical protein